MAGTNHLYYTYGNPKYCESYGLPHVPYNADCDNEPHMGHGEFKGKEARSGQQSFGKGAITFIVSIELCKVSFSRSLNLKREMLKFVFS